MQNRFTLFRSCLLAAASLFLPFAIPFAVSAQTSNVPPRITAAVNESQLTTLRGNTHPLARAEFDQGPAPDSLPMERMLLVLTRSTAQETALEALLGQQQDASSPNYHQWLTPQQFGLQFGPADSDIQTVTLWLQSHGFTVNRVSNGRTVIEFSGTAGQVRGAFHTQIHQYNVNGENHWANASDPQIPTALTPVVAGIDTLNNFPRHAMHHAAGVVSRSKSTGKLQSANPLFTLGGNCGVPGLGCYGVTPYDFATIYNELPLWNASPAIDGTGQTIAVVAESDIALSDVSSFRSYFGLAPKAPTIILDGPDPGTVQGDETESDLDIEWAGAVAKGATIDVVTSESTEASLGVDLSAQYIVDNNLAGILSESYGICELFLGAAGNQFYNQLWQQASAQGITALVATGDSGSAVCDRNAGTTGAAQFGLSVSGFSSTPYNVAVGGTDFFDLTNASTYWSATNSVPPGAPGGTPATLSALSYIPETTWNNSCTNAVFGNLLGFSNNAETNCNNDQLIANGFVVASGGSGGKSNCTTYDGTSPSSCTGGYPKPTWQAGTGVPMDEKRDVPDVSLFAAAGSPSGAFYLICEADAVQSGSTSCDSSDPETQFFAVGGTSASTPAFAGIMALVEQKTGSRQGNANYILYKLAAQSGASCNSSNGAGTNCVFYDVTNGTIAMPCVTDSPNCNTTFAGDATGVLAGYSTTTGYDQATGLGSVNANNLVTSWKTFAGTLKSSATTLTLNGGAAVNITHGTSVSVASTVGPVAPETGTPTGSVSLIANTQPPTAPSEVTQQGVQEFTLSGGDAMGSTVALPGGTYTVFAQYTGDGTFSPSESTTASVTVTPESSKTSVHILTIDPSTGAVVNSNATTFPYGSPYILRADVTNGSGNDCFNVSSGNPTYGCPTGEVAITGNSTPLAPGTFALNSEGYTEDQAIELSAGSYTLSGSYGGDHSYNASSGTDAVTVSQAPTTTTSVFNPPITTVIIGTPFGINGMTQSQSDGAAPGGSYTVLDGTTPLTGSGTFDGFAGSSTQTASCQENIAISVSAPTGPHTLTVRYNGDSNYLGSTSAPVTVDAVYGTQTAVVASVGTIQQGQSVTLTATVTLAQNGGPAATGTVQFRSNAANVGTPVTLSGNMAQLMTTALLAGSDQIVAVYSGDSNYASSTSLAITENVTPGPTFVMSVNPTVIPVTAPGQAGTATLTFTGQNGFSSNGAVTITPTCSGMPSETSCSSGTSITIPANGSAMATITFQTTAPSVMAPATRNRPNFAGSKAASGPLALGCLLCAAMILFSYREKRRRWGVALMFTVFALLAVSVGCGGGGSTSPQNPGTPVGNYTGVSVSVTINGVTQTISGLMINVE
jgi:subtilase family serine protease